MMAQLLKLATWIILLLAIVVGCGSQPAPTATRIISLPTPTMREPTPGFRERPTSVPAKEVTVNENPYRYATFNINTLAHELPSMDLVAIDNITYAYNQDTPLTIDVYYPPGINKETQLPAVIFGLGYPVSRQRLRNAHFYTSWGRLVAAAGMVGVIYDTEQPDRDLEILLDFIRQHAAELRIDPSQIGFMSTSANTATVMSYLMQEKRPDVRFSIYYYGLTLTPDRKFTEVISEECASIGCVVNELADVTYVDPELPLMVVKAGRDDKPGINEAMDYFVEYVKKAGAPVTYIEYEEGLHGFDTQQKTEESAAIIAQTIDFMKSNFGME